MADELKEVPQAEGDVLELQPEQIATEGQEGEVQPAVDDEEVIVSIGDEAAPASGEEAPEWVRDLRKRNRELERELAEARKGTGPSVPEVGQEPTLEGCDYDEDRFKQETKAWLKRTEAAESAKSEAEKAKEESTKAWNAKLLQYGEQKDTLGVRDFESAEAVVLSSLNEVQQSIIIAGAKDKALLVLALGRNPGKLADLAKIQDPIEFAFAAARLEAQTKMERKRPATTPEGKVQGSAQITQSAGELSDKLSADEWRNRRNAQVRNRG